MFSTFHYVPVLKWKQGEYLALASLSETVRQAITPVIEIVEPDTKPLDKHLETSIDNVERAWGSSVQYDGVNSRMRMAKQ